MTPVGGLGAPGRKSSSPSDPPPDPLCVTDRRSGAPLSCLQEQCVCEGVISALLGLLDKLLALSEQREREGRGNPAK